MSRRQHRVILTPAQRQRVRTLAASSSTTALAFQHARILLLADEAQRGRRHSDQAVAEAVGVSARTVARLREQFATQGLDACLERRPTRRVYPTRLDDAQQAHLTKLACSTPPDGRARWTLKPWQCACWVIPPAQDATFAAAMDATLDRSARPRDPRFPLVCFDEAGKELRAHTRDPQLLRPGSPQRIDPEYVRKGAANLFLWVAPYEGQRHITATARRCAGDVAYALRELVAAFPDAKKVVLLTDNLNVHAPASLSKTFPRDEARRILARLEWHFTPKHGSWLNLAEVELAALHGQCLERRIPDLPTLQHEVDAWAAARNARRQTIAWSFTADDAYAKLRHVYPIPDQDTVR